MHRNEIILQVDEAFSGERRPAIFIRGTCFCDECVEHSETMSAFKQTELPLEALNRPGWDPICFASNEAFRYLLPGLVRLVLEHSSDYIDQFLFHVEQPDRIACLSPKQAAALARVLDFLVLNAAEALDDHLAADQLFRAQDRLRQVAGPTDLPRVDPS